MLKINWTAGMVLVAAAAVCGVSMSAMAEDVQPRGSLVAVTTSLSGAGQDQATTITNLYKPYWDEVFDYPVIQDETGNLAPGLAESWAPSEDLLTWTFVIRQGVKFHNGDTLTAEDVAWSWNRLIFGKESKHVLSGYAPVVESVTVDGPDKVLVKTKSPQSLLPLWFAKVEGNLGGTVQSKKYVETVGVEKAYQNPIGTGPYRFVSMDGEQSVTLTAFDDPTRSEWQKTRTPGFKDLKIIAVPEVSTRLALLKTGGADLVPLSLSAAEDLSSTPGIKPLTVPSTNYSGIWCIGFTLNPASPCNDQKVREALSIAIDRETIATAIYRGDARPSAGWYGGPGSFGYPTDLAPAPFDPEKAQKLLEEAGFGPSNPLKVLIMTYNDDVDFPALPTLAEAIAGYYEGIGIQPTIKVTEWDAMKEDLLVGKLPGQGTNEVSPVVLFMRGMDNRYYFPAEHIGAYTSAGRIGAALWDNTKLPEQQQRLDAVGAAFDLNEQEKLFADYYKWMAENYNHIPLLAADTVFGVSDRVKGWKTVAGKPFIHQLYAVTPADTVQGN